MVGVCGGINTKAKRSQNRPSKKRKDRISLNLKSETIANMLTSKAKILKTVPNTPVILSEQLWKKDHFSDPLLAFPAHKGIIEMYDPL